MIYSRIIHNIKQRSNATLKAWTYQCESILAQRSRRIQQLFTFYHRVYGTHGLKQLIKAYHRHLPPFKGKNFVLCTIGLMGVSVTGGRGKGGGVGQHFDWNRERLSLGNFDKCQKDIEFIETLPKNKLCNQCQAKSMKYCYCLIGNKDLGRKSGSKSITINPMYKPDNKTDHGGSHSTGSVDGARVMGQKLIDLDNTRPWEPYLSKDHYSIWKREESNAMYSYKVYAYFKDISAADFLHIQTDIKYRKEWDETAVVLKLIEEDPIPGNNSHLIYWEMQWPKLFTNRDYVYCRRFISDEKRKLIMIASRATKHPAYPEKPGKVRVKNYWSLMVIKPYRNFHEPGLHYVLTYFDDPGIAIPQSIKSWITQKQMPDFLQKMYKATKDYSYKRAKAMKAVFNSFTKLDHEYTANAHREHWLKRLWCNGSRTSNNTENDVNIANHNNNNSNNSNNNNNNSNNNNNNNNNSNTNNNSIANNSNNTNNNNTSNSNSNSSININTNNSKIRRLNSE